eukprot:tig00020780_g13768.t1
MRSPQAAQALAGAVPAAAARTADVPGTPPASESSGGAASLPAATASAAAAGAPRLGVINDHCPASAAFDEGPVPPRAMLREGGSLYMSHRNMSAWPATAINAIGPANVRVLWLAGNKITAIPGAQLAKLVNLEKLDVSCNLLETLPIELGRLERLRTLICHRNPFGALPEAGRPRGTEDSNDTLQYMRSPQAAQALAGAAPAEVKTARPPRSAPSDPPTIYVEQATPKGPAPVRTIPEAPNKLVNGKLQSVSWDATEEMQLSSEALEKDEAPAVMPCEVVRTPRKRLDRSSTGVIDGRVVADRPVEHAGVHAHWRGRGKGRSALQKLKAALSCRKGPKKQGRYEIVLLSS